MELSIWTAGKRQGNGNPARQTQVQSLIPIALELQNKEEHFNGEKAQNHGW
jgi:hypothetical protein